MGTIRDIRTGRAIGKTKDLNETFTYQVQGLLESGEPFYMVYGRCTMQQSRRLVDDMKSLGTFPVIYDRQFPPDWVLLFSGQPEELGFAC